MWTIRPVRLGELEVDQSALTALRGAGSKVRIPCLGWVLLSDAGEVLVVDAGPPPPDVVRTRKDRILYREASDEPAQAFREAGVDLKNLRDVVISHLHWDHIGNLALFPNARLLVQRTELSYAIAPLPLHAAPYEALDGRLVPLWVQDLPRMVAVEGEFELRPGVSLHPLPGHTPGLQGVRVVTAAGAYVIASDAVPTFANWTLRIPSATYTDLNAYERSFAKLERIADHVLPSHDGKVLESVQYPPPAEISGRKS